MRWRIIAVCALPVAVAVAIAVLVVNAHVVNHWLAVHTGTVNEPGPYYGFWSGFGSDLAEFAIIGTIGTGVYQLVKKYNCHQPGLLARRQSPRCRRPVHALLPPPTPAIRETGRLARPLRGCTASILRGRWPSTTSYKRCINVWAHSAPSASEIDTTQLLEQPLRSVTTPSAIRWWSHRPARSDDAP
jgi:hypothetical protein